MEHQIVFHPKAESELEQLYDDIAGRASPAIAWNFIAGIRDHCLGLSTFPQRGTERVEIMPGLRIVGYRRAVSIAFAVEGGRVLIPGHLLRWPGHHTGIARGPALNDASVGNCFAAIEARQVDGAHQRRDLGGASQEWQAAEHRPQFSQANS